MKIVVICSAGGHLDEALAVLEAFAGHEIVLISYDASVMGNGNLKDFTHASIARTYLYRLKGTSGFSLFLTLLIGSFSTFRIFLKERPDLIFSTGSEIALPGFFIGKFLFRAKLVFLETATRVIHPSLTAK